MQARLTKYQIANGKRGENVFSAVPSKRGFVVLAIAWAVAIAGMLSLGSARLHAQINAATLNGTITDSTGAVVVGATVDVTNTGTAAIRTTTTNAMGFWVVPSLPPGPYTVTLRR